MTRTYTEIGHVRNEHIDLDDLLNAGTCRLKHGLEILDASRGLLVDCAINEVAIAVLRDLAGTVDGVGSLDRLGRGRKGGFLLV